MKLNKEVTCSWICHFNMVWYPFDTQTCSMEFYHKNPKLVMFLPDKLSYTGPRELPEYFVHTTQMCSAIIEGKPGVKVKIIFGRRIFSTVLTVFTPTIILVIISHMVNHFQENYLDMVISVNLTVLLVLATL